MKTRKFYTFPLLIALLLFIQSTSFASAAPSTTADLDSLSSSMIDITTLTDNSGAVQRSYRNIDSFISYVQENTAISDYDLAIYIMNYTGA